MATAQEHKSKALHNESFLGAHELAEGEFVDWAVTVLFYSALHWMRALAAQEGYQVRAYRGEFGEDKAFARLFSPQAYDWYRQLKDESRDARYEMKQFSPSDFSELRLNFFEPFKSFVAARLRD